MAWTDKFKRILRHALPGPLRVPVKFWSLRVRGLLEAEIALLPFLVHGSDLALDIGANDGIYAYALRRLNCVVAAFEPNPEIAASLAAWADSLATIHAVALSDCLGHADLYIPRDITGTEHDAAASITGRRTGEGRIVAVETALLDSFDYRDAALIKIDVEGHEDRVLAGAQATITASLPALIIEIEQRHSERPIHQTFAAITAMGYDGWYLRAGKLVPLPAFNLERDQSAIALAGQKQPYCNNFLFLHRQKLESGAYRALFAAYPAT